MPISQKTNEIVSISRIFLYLDNPRHKPVQAEAKAIHRLCEGEYILPLARDIVKNGLNPLEKFALIPLDILDVHRSSSNYHAAEGNRRVCAIKLLNDPQLAPPNLRKSFEKLATNWTPIKSVSAVIFDDLDDVRLWLDRIHSGL